MPKCYCEDCGEDREVADVAELHDKFGILGAGEDGPAPLTRELIAERITCMMEELTEFSDAVVAGDFAGQADALIDLAYFAKGTAVMMGLPWHWLWSDVHRANMAKVRGVGPRGHKVDLIKPPGWVGPQTKTILQRCGFKLEAAPRGYGSESGYKNGLTKPRGE
jgi:hypothetical protein